MQVFALGILVVRIAERDGAPELAPFYLGLIGLARAIPGLAFTLVAGAVADRVDRRRLLIITQSTMAVNAAALAIFVALGTAGLWHVIVAAMIQSTAFAFDNPSRQSLVPRLVPMTFYASAIGLQSAAFNGASIVGPVLAGVLYIPIGIAGLLAVNALSFVAILGALKALPAVPPSARPTHSLLSSVLDGARYVRADPVLSWILVVAGTVFVVAGPAGALLPAVAGESTWQGMSWLSLLLAAFGLGSFSAALVVMNVGRIPALGRVFVGAATMNGLMLVLFALSAEPAVALAFAVLTGFGGTLMAGSGNNMLQATTDDGYRGRVMSVWGFMFIGLMPIGQLALGALGSLLGVHASLAIGGATAAAAGLYGALRVPALRTWRMPRHDEAVARATVAVGQPTFR